jgi:hypothetical protein
MSQSSAKKNILVSLLVTLLTGSVSAQAPGRPLQNIADTFVNSLVGAIEWYPTTEASLTSAILEIFLPFLAVYFAANFIIGKGIQYAEANFRDRTSIRSDDMSDAAKRATQAISAVMAIWTVVIYGGFLAIYWYLAGIVLFIFLIWILLTGGIGVMSPLPEWLTGGERPDLFDGKADEAAEEADRAQEEAAQAENQAEREEQQAEEDAEAGNTQQADREAEQAADDEQRAIEDMEIAAQDIDKLLELEEEQLNRTVKELKQTNDEVVHEEQVIEKLEEDLSEVNSYIDRIQSEFTGASSSSDAAQQLREKFPIQRLADEIPENINSRIVEAGSLVERLADEVNENRRELSKESEEIDQEVKELLDAQRLLKKLKAELNEGEELDKRIENLAQKLEDKGLFKEAEAEIEEEKKIEEQVEMLLGMEEDIENALSTELKILQRLVEIDEKELEELRAEEGEFGNFYEKLPRLTNSLVSLVEDNREGPAVYYVDENPGNPNEITPEERNRVVNALRNLESGEESNLERIKNALDQIEEAKKQNEKLEEKMIGELKDALK